MYHLAADYIQLYMCVHNECLHMWTLSINSNNYIEYNFDPATDKLGQGGRWVSLLIDALGHTQLSSAIHFCVCLWPIVQNTRGPDTGF